MMYMEQIKKVFNSVDAAYLTKSYIISAIVTFIMLSGSDGIGNVLFVIVSGILFPFSAMVWDDLISLMAGGTFLLLPLPAMAMWKVFKVLILWYFSIVIAPLGIAYIIFRNKNNERINS